MKKCLKTLTITIYILTLCISHTWASQVTIPNNFQKGEPASADEVNMNFTAIKEAVNDNDKKIKSVVEPGVQWYDEINPVEVLDSVEPASKITVKAPSSGYVIVTSSGFVNWLVKSNEEGLIDLGLSLTDDSIDSPHETIGINGINTFGYYRYPFSITRVFTVSSGNNTFYFNTQFNDSNKVVGAAWVHCHTLVGLFVPNRYNE